MIALRQGRVSGIQSVTALAMPAAIACTRFRHVVDVGSGESAFLAELLKRDAHLTGTVPAFHEQSRPHEKQHDASLFVTEQLLGDPNTCRCESHSPSDLAREIVLLTRGAIAPTLIRGSDCAEAALRAARKLVRKCRGAKTVSWT